MTVGFTLFDSLTGSPQLVQNLPETVFPQDTQFDELLAEDEVDIPSGNFQPHVVQNLLVGGVRTVPH